MAMVAPLARVVGDPSNHEAQYSLVGKASYQPSRAVPKVPATSSLEKILESLEGNGGVILTDFRVTEEHGQNRRGARAPYQAHRGQRFLRRLYRLEDFGDSGLGEQVRYHASAFLTATR